MITSDGIHKMGRIIIVCIVTICLTALYITNPDIDPDIVEKILFIPLAYIAVKGSGNKVE